MTVNGLVNREDLGFITPHEHLLIDITNQFQPFDAITDRVRSMEKVQLSNLDAIRRNPYAVKDNLALNEPDVAIEEITRFKKAGGKTVVDVTLIGIGRDVLFLRGVANLLDMNIIAGTGLYTQDTHPTWAFEASVDDVVEYMMNDITVGVDQTDIKAGIIGEIGTSDVILDNERKCLLASAIVHQQTGLGMEIHTFPWTDAAFEVAQILIEHNVDPKKICILHTDVEFNMDLVYRLLDLGVILEFENFGKECYIDKRYRGFAGGFFESDLKRVKVMIELCEKGYASQLMVATDICLKQGLHKYGGFGYDHILLNIIPMMLNEGLDKKYVDQIVRDNPLNFIDSN